MKLNGRSVGAIAAGFATVVVGSTVVDAVLHGTGIFPPPGQAMDTSLWVLASAYRAAFAISGCWLAAHLAPSRPMLHALVLGGIGLLAATAGTLATWEQGPEFGPRWYPLSLVVTALPCAWIGGVLYQLNAPRGRATA